MAAAALAPWGAVEVIADGSVGGVAASGTVSRSAITPGSAALLLVAIAVVGVAAHRGLLRLSRPPRDAGISAVALVALALAMLLSQQVGASVGAALAGGAPPVDAPASATARMQAFAIVGAFLAQLPGVVALARLRGGAPRARAVDAGLGLLVAAVAWPIVAATAAAAAWAQERLLHVSTDALAHDTLQLIARPDARPWGRALALLAVVAAPIVEETFYRGLLQPAARSAGLSAWASVVVVAALFAVMHASVAPPPALAALFVFGVALGWARERTGGLLASIVAHAAFNAGNLALAM